MSLSLLTEGQGVEYRDENDESLWRIEVSDEGKIIAVTQTPFGPSRQVFEAWAVGQALEAIGCHWAVARRALEMLQANDLLPSLDTMREQVLAAVGRVTKTGPQIAKLVGCSRSTAGRYLREAHEKGWVQWFGESGWYIPPLPQTMNHDTLFAEIEQMGIRDVNQVVAELLLWWTRKPLEVTGHIHWLNPYVTPRLVIFENIAGTRNCRALGTYEIMDADVLKERAEKALSRVATGMTTAD